MLASLEFHSSLLRRQTLQFGLKLIDQTLVVGYYCTTLKIFQTQKSLIRFKSIITVLCPGLASLQTLKNPEFKSIPTFPATQLQQLQ